MAAKKSSSRKVTPGLVKRSKYGQNRGKAGKTKDKPRDAQRTAIKPGKRISKNGKMYWETRQNRSDHPGKI